MAWPPGIKPESELRLRAAMRVEILLPCAGGFFNLPRTKAAWRNW